VFLRAAPLVEKLRNRTISRTRYGQLHAIMAQNALLTGQVDETAKVLTAMDEQWKWCPARYLSLLNPRTFAFALQRRMVRNAERGPQA
jgi:hypothetical protein